MTDVLMSSCSRIGPTRLRPVARLLRALELIAWGLAAPFALAILHPGRAVLPWLWLATIAVSCLLFRDPEFDPRVWDWNRVRDGQWFARLVRWGLASAFLAAWLAWKSPEMLFWLPRHRPGFWLAVLVFYALVSVVPQTIVYRVFFFHRYRVLFSSPALAMHSAAAVFAIAHVVFLNPWAVILSWVAGYWFVWTYVRTGSAWAVTLEHILYGWTILTLGWGRWFYHGSIGSLDAWIRT